MKPAALQAAALVAVCVASSAIAAGPVTVETLLEEMIDLRRLVEFPQPVYQTVQFSSYDHRSTLPGGPDWFANSDGFGKEPIPNFEEVLVKPNEKGIGEYLVCDVQGPGAIVRVWTAAIKGDIRMYLDDATEPLFEGSAQDFFLQPFIKWAQAAGLDPSVFENTFKQRCACYLPIPFAKRCRVVWIGDIKQIHFYHLQIRRYAPGTQVASFHPPDLKTHETTIRRVAQVLADPQARWPYKSTAQPVAVNANAAAQQAADVLSWDGPKALERLTLKVSAADLDRALRQTLLKITFDNHSHPQVESPIGDFFGAAPGINPFNSVPLTVEADGSMTCRFVMPFARSCRIVLENRSEQPVTMTGSVLPMDYAWDDARSMHFRARWRVDHEMIADADKGAQDLPYLLAEGTGVFVGATAMLLNPNAVPTSGGNWWGEGDEKIFVDGEARPSTFGTGSEDYFNYAWSSSDIFVLPYCGQPRNDGPANRGFVTNQRWHVLDCLPFQRGFRFYMELYSHERTPGLSYARMAYHYARPGLTDDHLLITDAHVRHLELPANWQPAARGRAKGAVFHQAEDLLSGTAEGKSHTNVVSHNLWAGGKLLLWRPAAKGEELAFKLPLPADGPYSISITAARTPQSGKISATLDGKKAEFGGGTGVIDLRVGHGLLSRTDRFDAAGLIKGDHELKLRYEGGPDDGSTGEVGLDFIWVQKR